MVIRTYVYVMACTLISRMCLCTHTVTFEYLQYNLSTGSNLYTLYLYCHGTVYLRLSTLAYYSEIIQKSGRRDFPLVSVCGLGCNGNSASMHHHLGPDFEDKPFRSNVRVGDAFIGSLRELHHSDPAR